MGMYYRIIKATDSQLQEFHDTPEKISRFIYRDDFDTSSLSESKKPRLSLRISYMLGLKRRPEKDSDLVVTHEKWQAPEEIEIDKSWHVIHYLLCGSVWEGDQPGSYLLTGKKIGG